MDMYEEVEIEALFCKSSSNWLEVGTSEHRLKSAKPFTFRTNHTAGEGSGACQATSGETGEQSQIQERSLCRLFS